MSWTPTVLKAVPKQPVTEQESALDELLDGMEAAGVDLGSLLDGKEPSATYFAGAYPSEPSPLEE